MTSICSSCKQSKSNECFSKKQFKRPHSEPEYAIKCIDCLKEIVTKLKQQNKQQQKQGKQQQHLKPSDPSQLYFLSPLNAPILKDFQKFFAKEYSFQNPPPAIHLGRKTKWRTSVKLAVRGEIGIDRKVTTHIGLFHPGSHTVVDCMNSVAHHGRINEAVKFIHSVMTTLQINGSIEGLDSEDKKIHKYHAYIRYLLLSLERKSGLIQLSIVWNASKQNTIATPFLQNFIDQLMELTLVKNSQDFSYKKSKIFHSIWVNYFPVMDVHNNAITGRERDNWELKYGKEYVEETIVTDFQYPIISSSTANKSKMIKPILYFPPFVFRQANIDKFEEIIQLIRLQIKEFRTVGMDSNVSTETTFPLKCLELYGGVGTIGLNCLDLIDRLQCSDENPHNIVSFNKTLEGLPTELANRATYRPYGAAASVMNGEIFQNNFIIVDPPRKGMDEETIRAFLVSRNIVALESSTSMIGVAAKRKKISFDEEGNVAEGDGTKVGLNRQRLVYVSCGFEAFKRDCLLLTGKKSLEESIHLFQNNEEVTEATGNTNKRKRNDFNESATYDNYWKLVSAQGFVLFPGSDHVETVAVFDRE